MIHHVPKQLKQPHSTFLHLYHMGNTLFFPGEPQDFLAFPSLGLSVPAGTTGSFPPFSCLQNCLLSTWAVLGIPGYATASVEPRMGRGLWAPAGSW